MLLHNCASGEFPHRSDDKKDASNVCGAPTCSLCDVFQSVTNHTEISAFILFKSSHSCWPEGLQERHSGESRQSTPRGSGKTQVQYGQSIIHLCLQWITSITWCKSTQSRWKIYQHQKNTGKILNIKSTVSLLSSFHYNSSIGHVNHKHFIYISWWLRRLWSRQPCSLPAPDSSLSPCSCSVKFNLSLENKTCILCLIEYLYSHNIMYSFHLFQQQHINLLQNQFFRYFYCEFKLKHLFISG